VADVVKPVVRLFFPCDEAVLDLADGKWMLKNPWHTVAMPPGVAGDFVQQEIWLYAQLTGGLGTFYLSVHLHDEDGTRIVKSQPFARDFPGGLIAVEEVFHLIDIPFDRPGLYEFKLLANHAELEGGTVNLRVLQG